LINIEEKKEVNNEYSDTNLNTNLPNKLDDINNLKINLMKKKEKPKTKINKFYSTFKRINEYLESNNIPLFELIKYNPFQSKPYQIPKGYEFLQAVKFKNYQFVKEALETSTDFLFVFDYYGQTCYHWAAKLGNIKMLLLLLDYGKYHNQKDFKGRTPLYLAAVNNNREICDLLLKYKANIHLKDNSGKSASDVAGSRELKYYLGDMMTQPFSNPVFKKKVLNFLKIREKDIEKKKIVKKFKEIEEEYKNENDEEKDYFN
jgi:ankyrin repeat protein